VSRYGDAICIDCGTVSARLLHPGFPHICSLCLFPPTKPEDPTADLIAAPPQWTPADTLVERLAAKKGNGVFRGFLDAYGKSMPESYNRRRWE
jgi:hypothetical protein